MKLIKNMLKALAKTLITLLQSLAEPFIAFSVIAEETRNMNAEAEAYKRMKRKERR